MRPYLLMSALLLFLPSAAHSDPIPVFSTVEAASNAAIPSGAVIQVLGYDRPGVGGATYRRADPGAEAGIASFASADGTVWQLAGRVVTPENFGARCDGRTDDHAALTKWLNAAKAGAYEAVMTPGRQCLTSRLLSAHGVTSMVVRGAAGASIRRTGNPAAPVGSGIFHIAGGVSEKAVFTGLRLIGNSGAELESKGNEGDPAIQVGGVDGGDSAYVRNVTISDNIISGFSWAAVVIYGNRGEDAVVNADNIDVSDNYFLDNYAAVAIYKNTANISISRNTIRRVGQTAIFVDALAQNDGSEGEANYDASITHNHIEDAGRWTQGIGILYKGRGARGLIAFNTILNTGVNQPAGQENAFGIYVGNGVDSAGPGNVDILGNKISRVAAPVGNSYGIYVGSHVDGARVARNSIEEVGAIGIHVQESSNVAVKDNILRAAGDVYAIAVDGTEETKAEQVIINGNSILRGASQADAAVAVLAADFVSAAGNHFTGFAEDDQIFFSSGSARRLPVSFAGSATPSRGYHIVGDRKLNERAGPGMPTGWICTEAGAPGKWEPIGHVPIRLQFPHTVPALAGDAPAYSFEVPAPGVPLASQVLIATDSFVPGLRIWGQVTAKETVSISLENRSGKNLPQQQRVFDISIQPF